MGDWECRGAVSTSTAVGPSSLALALALDGIALDVICPCTSIHTQKLKPVTAGYPAVLPGPGCNAERGPGEAGACQLCHYHQITILPQMHARVCI